METCFNYCQSDMAFFSSDERRWINKIHKLNKQNPNEVIIIKEPNENDGCIYVKMPIHYLRLQPKRKVSEEQRAMARERFLKSKGE